MKKSEAKQKLQAGEIQIHFDDKSKSELLRELFGYDMLSCEYKYYSKNKLFIGCDFNPVALQIVKISKITEDEEVIWEYFEIQFKYGNEGWQDVSNNKMKYRLKPKPDFTKEIDALNLKAKEAGMKAVVTFEKI